MAFLLLASVGCRRKDLDSEQVRAITREMILAAQKALGREIDIGMRPEAPQRGPAADRAASTGKNPAAPPSDLLYITLHNPARLGDLERTLNRVATAHGLSRRDVAQAPPAPGLVRMEFRSGSRRTHAVSIFLPAARRVSSSPATPRSPRPDPSRAGGPRPAATPNGPRLAIIIDDVGYDRAAAEALFALPYPFNVSVLPNLPYSAELAEEAQRFGYQVMLHLPMESANGDAKPEAVELRVGMNQEEVARVVSRMLESVPYAVGTNNHQGSRATTDPNLMAELMPVLQQRELFFVDSRTTAGSVAYAAARRAGIPAAYRTVFLDDIQTRDATLQQLAQAERAAREQGWAIAIGHPHPTTLEALAEFLPAMESRGVRLVFVSELVR